MAATHAAYAPAPGLDAPIAGWPSALAEEPVGDWPGAPAEVPVAGWPAQDPRSSGWEGYPNGVPPRGA